MTTGTEHHHEDIEQAGRCPDCRDRTIAMLADAPRYLCIFPEDNSIAIVRSWDPDALRTAWAIGCQRSLPVGFHRALCSGTFKDCQSFIGKRGAGNSPSLSVIITSRGRRERAAAPRSWLAARVQCASTPVPTWL